ncbi:MAG: hypothetical protein LC791_14745 [Acidobacteria bacterium]|nr:hypothetical protein [Acidobacteriota bacterium]
MSRSVVVKGIGVVSALGASATAFRDGLLEGRTGIRPLERFDVRSCRTQAAAPIVDIDAARWITPMKLRRLDVTARYAFIAARQACDDAGYVTSDGPNDQAGIIFGTFSAGGEATSEYLDALHRGGPSGAPALLFSSTVGNAAASFTGLELGFRGPNVTVSQKEASGLTAVTQAVDLLRDSRAATMIAGGVDAIFEVFFTVHDRFAVMAPGDGEAAPSRPFDAHRSGFVLGEGGFALFLERELAVSTPTYGRILGVGTAGASVPINQWPPRPEPLVRTMRMALEDAALGPDAVNAVYASANATTTLDRVEAEALTSLFRSHRPVITSIKGAIGECGASGAASCAAALLCGGVGKVAPIAGLRNIDKACADLDIAREVRPLPGPIVLVNSFASGGSLASVVLHVQGR